MSRSYRPVDSNCTGSKVEAKKVLVCSKHNRLMRRFPIAGIYILGCDYCTAPRKEKYGYENHKRIGIKK